MQVFTDPASGRRYTVDPQTGQSAWLDTPPPGNPQQYAAPQPPAKRHVVRNVILGIVGVLVLMGGWTQTAQTDTAGAAAASTSAPKAAAPTPVVDEGTVSQRNALKSAQSYLAFAGFSRLGLIQQLSSSAGDGYPKADATWAVDRLKADWNEQAVRSGQSYLDMTGFSRAGLIQQLSSSAGDKYTKAQATYAADKLGLK